MDDNFLSSLDAQLEQIRSDGLYKPERILTSPQQADITTTQGQHVLNLCANNYLGLANHPQVIQAAQQALETHGFGMASVRFICGTHKIHKELEQTISRFLVTDDTILYSSCFDSNTGLFETLLSEEDAIISDALNHASIIDGIRLCKAKRFRYKNNDMDDLEKQLKEAQSARYKIIATDGVFSMNGTLAQLDKICELSNKYKALVMVDDCHAAGFLGPKGKGTPAHFGVSDEIDIITGTLGKALGGASGGYTSGRRSIIEWLRQRSRPYLFSNALAPMITAASLKVFEILSSQGDSLRQQLNTNTQLFRQGLTELGFNLIAGEHPIIPIMIGDAKMANQMAEQLLEEGIYVIGFSYPVVPHNQARIRVQMSASLTEDQLNQAITTFQRIGKKLGLI